MLSLSKMGLGSLRPYLFVALFSTLFTFVNTSRLHAQIDINVDIVQMPFLQGENSISVSPNPVVTHAKVEYGNDITLQSLTILDQSITIMTYIDHIQGGSFLVSLFAGLTYWNFQTSSGMVSRQVMVAEI
jgi:hypothetical protein